ncbi:unnamed protein product [Lactuca virosa]|uniref:GH16 domain-containing protein n=1 Tax=Lactuca virosa TaxID=75947 RepID=A0AAU9NN26_9ASTR|nr:unnamed protein product [Lactuca virosa]
MIYQNHRRFPRQSPQGCNPPPSSSIVNTGASIISTDYYNYGFFGAKIKSPTKYTAGIVFAFYVISASGAVKHEDVVDQVKKMFTKLSANPMTTPQLVEKEPAIFTGSEIWKKLW